MKSRKQFITEPGDRRWLDATPLAAAAGGLIVVLLLGTMVLLHPGERAAAVGEPPATPLSPESPAYALPSIAPDAESYAAPGSQPPTF